MPTPRRSFTIRDRTIAEDAPPYLIAEIACGHQGRPDDARALVDAAVAAGADAVQFELFDPADNMAPTAKLYPLLCDLNFTAATWDELFTYARRFDIAVFAFVYDLASMALVPRLKPDAIKLNSSDLSTPEMVAAAARSGLPVTLGTGSSTFDEVAKAVALALDNGGDRLVLMHGVQAFPTSPDLAHIRRVGLLRQAFGCLVGYADHTDAATDLAQVLDLAALGQGAAVLEKHVVVNRAAKGVDWQAALEPAEFARWVEAMRAGARALGAPAIAPLSDNDHRYRQFQKKSLTAAADLPKGTRVTRDAIVYLRHGEGLGLPPSDIDRVLGKTTTRDIARYDLVRIEDLAG